MSPQTTDRAAAHQALNSLASELKRRHFDVQVYDVEGRPPNIIVTNTVATALTESVLTAPDDHGALWYWFPWRAPIAPIDDVNAAANRVERVLAEVGRPIP